MYIIGIDGGGTSTQGAIANHELSIIAESQVGATNYHNVGFDTAKERLGHLLNNLLIQAGIDISELSGICFGGAGIDSDADKETLIGIFRALGWQGSLIVVNDSVTALTGGNRGLEGMVLISGTGSIGYASYGECMVRCGGWGQLIDDVGSGYYLGISALKGIMEAYDYRRARTKLWDPVAEHLGIRQEEDIIHFLYHPQTGKEKIAELAPYVIQLAHEDPLASEIYHAGINGLVHIITGLIKQVESEIPTHEKRYTLALGGSLLTKSQVYREAFIKAIAEKHPEVEVHLPYEGPVAGALRIINDYVKKEREPNA